MGFFDKIFKSESSEDYSDWLLNAVDVLNSHFKKQESLNSVSGLLAFTSMATFKSGSRILTYKPSSTENITDILCCLRGFYQSYWWLKLLEDNDEKKVEDVFFWFDHHITTLIDSLFEQSQSAKKLFSPAFSDYYRKFFFAVDKAGYIDSRHISNSPNDNTAALFLCRIGKIPDDYSVVQNIKDIINDSLNDSRLQKHLDSFDIDKVIDIPDQI
tara:strand:+ start:72 stop:713 length:642 start_codon:yes stop_codon:yes gene_type:complete